MLLLWKIRVEPRATAPVIDSDQERGKGTRVIYLALIEGARAFILLCLHILLLTVVKFTNVYVHFIVCCTPCIMSVTFTQ